MESVDVYRTFTAAEARRIGIAPLGEDSCAFGVMAIPVELGVSEKEATGERRV